jgi:hypothetical protein
MPGLGSLEGWKVGILSRTLTYNLYMWFLADAGQLMSNMAHGFNSEYFRNKAEIFVVFYTLASEVI